MSAYVVSQDTVDLIVSAGIQAGHHSLYVWHNNEGHHFGYDKADELVSCLMSENIHSVNYRYNLTDDETYDTPCRFVHGIGSVIPWSYVLSSLECYEYQSCEHSERWNKSLAFAVCDSVRRLVCMEIASAEGAPWGWTRERVTA